MALTAPTVASDPATATHTNAALQQLNSYLTTAYSEAATATTVIRDHVQITAGAGAEDLVRRLNTEIGVLQTSNADPTVSTSPATLAQTTTALTTAAGYVDALTGSIGRVFVLIRHHFKIVAPNIARLVTFTAAQANMNSPAAQTVPTVASDPVSQAEMNTHLQTMTTMIDTFNTEFVALLNPLTEQFRLNPGNPVLMQRLANIIGVVAAH